MKKNMKNFVQYTPKVAESKMSDAGIDHKGLLRGSLKTQRALFMQEPRRYDGQFTGTMRRFCENPPDGVSILDGPEPQVTEHRTRIGFYNKKFLAEALQRIKTQGGVKLVADGTYKTNIQRLVLVCVGAVYLVPDKNEVHNRFVPLMFAVTDAEDHEAYELVLDGLVRVAADELGISRDAFKAMITDIYVDGSGGAEKATTI